MVGQSSDSRTGLYILRRLVACIAQDRLNGTICREGLSSTATGAKFGWNNPLWVIAAPSRSMVLDPSRRNSVQISPY